LKYFKILYELGHIRKIVILLHETFFS